MKTIRVPLLLGPQGWHVELPTYRMVKNTFQPLVPGLIERDWIALKVIAPDKPPENQDAEALKHHPTVLVEVPDSYAHDEKPTISVPKMRKLFAGQPLWDRDDFSLEECKHG